MERLGRFFTSSWFAAILLAAAYFLGVTALQHKSVTYDEIGHLTGGYGIWWKNDFRLVPDNGNLSQRWAAIPAFWRNDRFPTTNQDDWHVSNVYAIGDQFFYLLGNDADSLLFSGRAMMGLLIVFTGLLIYYWSRSLFGPGGALASVVLFAFCPTILAHGPLVTSDMMVTLFFLLSVTALWKLLHRVTIWTVLGSSLAMAGLFLSKLSGVLIIPMGILLLVMRLSNPEPLPVAWPISRSMRKAGGKLLVFSVVLFIQILLVWICIWGAFGFRYSAFAENNLAMDRLFPGGWGYALEKSGFVPDLVRTLSIGQWFPEAFLFGVAMVSRMGQARQSFLNGDFDIYGFRTYFPTAFVMKETIPYLLLLVLAGITAIVFYRRTKESAQKDALRHWIYITSPLWVLLVFYGAFALSSRLNIGHRHLLPIYPSLFVFAGAAGIWLSRKTMRWGAVVAALLVWHAAEGVFIYPHYLTYFNEAVGGPSRGYKHLVDSSYDWGQDLPGLKEWLREKGLEDGKTPVYLLYFGTARPEYYKINATQLPGYLDRVPIGPIEPLRPGVYCISATHFDGVYLYAYGPWTRRFEEAFRAQSFVAKEIMEAQGNPEALKKLEARYQVQGLQTILYEFPRLRTARLCAWLRQQDRQPDATIGHSILIFNLTAEDLRRAAQDPLPFAEPQRVIQ